MMQAARTMDRPDPGRGRHSSSQSGDAADQTLCNVSIMPSSRHETLIEIFRQQRTLAEDLLIETLGIAVPAHDKTTLVAADSVVLAPTEYRADAVVLLTDNDIPVMAIIVEVQLGRDADKRWSWPTYLTTLRARYQCPTALLVLSLDPAIASWCREPITLGPGSTVAPQVIGPGNVPTVVDPAQARSEPELTVLSALAHAADPAPTSLLNALLVALGEVKPELANLYCDLVLAALPAAARRELEKLMTTGTYTYQSDFARRYVGEGKAEAIVAVLEARRIPLADSVRAAILATTDPALLDGWLARVATTPTAEELLG